MKKWEEHLFWGALMSQGILLMKGAMDAYTGSHPTQIVVVFALSFIPYAVLLWTGPLVLTPHRTLQVALCGLFLVGGLFVFAPVILSDDLYRYLWEGRVLLSGSSPYTLSPDATELAPLRDEIWAHVNHQNLASVYPPLAQVFFAIFDLLGGHVWIPKLVALFAHLGVTVFVARVRNDVLAPLALAFNPMLLAEGALGGHLDLFVGFALCVAVWGLMRKRPTIVILGCVAAIGLKLVGFVLFPLLVRRLRVFCTVGVASLIMLLPMCLSNPGEDTTSGVGQFALRWRGNDSVYTIVQWGVTRALEARWGHGKGQLHIEGLDEAWSSAPLSRWDPRVAIADPDKGISHSDVIDTGVVATPLARVLVALCVLFVGVWLAWRNVDPVHGVRRLLWIVLLLSPQVHPWYLAWLLPIEVMAGGFAGLVWSASVLVAYAPLDVWIHSRIWSFPPMLLFVEYVPVGMAILWERQCNHDKHPF